MFPGWSINYANTTYLLHLSHSYIEVINSISIHIISYHQRVAWFLNEASIFWSGSDLLLSLFLLFCFLSSTSLLLGHSFNVGVVKEMCWFSNVFWARPFKMAVVEVAISPPDDLQYRDEECVEPEEEVWKRKYAVLKRKVEEVEQVKTW